MGLAVQLSRLRYCDRLATVHHLHTTVTDAIDRLDLHATAPTLLLDLQERLGKLSAEALRLTIHGRRPMRPDAGWERALGDLMFTMISIADQTGVDLERAVQIAIADLEQQAGAPTRRQPTNPVRQDKGWPLSYGD